MHTGFTQRRPIGLRPRLSTTALCLLAGVALCATFDLLLVFWISKGAPLGKTPDQFFHELTYILAGSFLAILVATLYPSRARVAIPGFLLVLGWHTGFQLSFSNDWPVTVSVVDVVVPLILALTLMARWHRDTSPGTLRPLLRLFLPFGAVCLWGVCLALIRGVDTQALLMNLKSFTIYPMLLPIMVWCISTWRQLYVALGLFLLLVLQRAFTGLHERASAGISLTLQSGQVVGRINGNFASINQFAFYLVSGLLLTLGLMVLCRSQRLRLMLATPLVVMVFALILTFSRGAYLATGAGLICLAFLVRVRKVAGLIAMVALVYALVQHAAPDAAGLVAQRLLTTQDQSLAERQDYYAIGTQAVLHYPFGAGWGAAFKIGFDGSLQTDHDPMTDWPWYHNDYLQLATEIGIPGLILFLLIWLSILRRGYRTVRRAPPGLNAAIIAGLIASVVGMLVQANADQFFWRTDIGPHPWMIGGLLLAAIHLMQRDLAQERPNEGR